MKKIVIFSAVFPPEPIVSARLSYDIAEELSVNNIVSVVCPRPTRPLGFKFVKTNYNTSFSVKVVNSFTCPKSNLLGRFLESISFGLKCKRFIKLKHKEIDTIYMNVWPLFAQFLILHTAIKFHIKVITHIQDIYPESQTNKLPLALKPFIHWLLLPIDKYVLKNSDHIITISEKMKQYLLKTRFLSPEKIIVVTNWQDENDFIKFHQKHKNSPNRDFLTFMYLGNIGPVAGVEFLIESFARAKLNGARLVVAGSGSRKINCQNLSLKYIDSQIEFIDVPDGKVAEIQDLADVMLLPIKKGAAMSSIPSKLPAYMFSKKPIIGCVDADSDTADSILKSDCGWIVEPDNTEQLINLFKSISIESKDTRINKGINGYNYAIERFSKAQNSKRIINLIQG